MTDKKTCYTCSGSGTERHFAGFEGLGLMGIPRYVNRTCPDCNGTGKVAK